MQFNSLRTLNLLDLTGSTITANPGSIFNAIQQWRRSQLVRTDSTCRCWELVWRTQAISATWFTVKRSAIGRKLPVTELKYHDNHRSAYGDKADNQESTQFKTVKITNGWQMGDTLPANYAGSVVLSVKHAYLNGKRLLIEWICLNLGRAWLDSMGI